MLSSKVFFILTDFLLKIINVNGAGSLQLSRIYHANDYAPGIVILAGIVKIMPALLTNQMTGILR